MIVIHSKTEDSVICFYKEYWHLPEHSFTTQLQKPRTFGVEAWVGRIQGSPRHSSSGDVARWARTGEGCVREGGAVSVCGDYSGFDFHLSLGSRSCCLG